MPAYYDCEEHVTTLAKDGLACPICEKENDVDPKQQPELRRMLDDIERNTPKRYESQLSAQLAQTQEEAAAREIGVIGPNPFYQQIPPYPAPYDFDSEAARQREREIINQQKLKDFMKELNNRGLTPPSASLDITAKAKSPVQQFATGATRSDDSYKIDPEGFFSPLVLTAYAEYMQEHRTQDNGQVRASDNWQRGMPFFKYMKSLWRHVLQLWLLHRGHTPETNSFLREKRAGEWKPVTLISALSGIMFNTQGYFHEYLMDSKAWEQRTISEQEDGVVITGENTRRRAA